MSTHVLIKVYGHIWPSTEQFYQALLPQIPTLEQMDEALELDGDLLRISFEGMYFPLEDVLPIIQSFLNNDSQGKLDYIDLEEWTLTRHSINGVNINTTCRSLNDVMDYSGH